MFLRDFPGDARKAQPELFGTRIFPKNYNGKRAVCQKKITKTITHLSVDGFFIVKKEGGMQMEFFSSAVGVLQTLVIALGAGLAIWGVINLMEGYGNDNPGAKSQGMKQLMAGGGVALIGILLVPQLANLFG